MRISMMSSEESNVDGSYQEEVLCVHSIPWRASRVNSMFTRLDEGSRKAKSPKARRQMKQQVGGDTARALPVTDTIPNGHFPRSDC